jgi:carbamoyltransferase
MNILGISCGYHDAAMTLINQHGDILFASHSERFSGVKHDPMLDLGLIDSVLKYGLIDTIAYYEIPWKRKIRELYSGQKSTTPWTLRQQLKDNGLIASSANTISFPHHLSHAAAGFQTSPFSSAACLVIDAVGEWDTVSIFDAHYNNNGEACYKKVFSKKYPNSIGLFYSAITEYIGLNPMNEEYITMGMAAWGAPIYKQKMLDEIFNGTNVKQNLHIGFPENYFGTADDVDIAASAQAIVEDVIYDYAKLALELTGSENLVYMGGVALNCVANSKLTSLTDYIWIMPNPGDAGSSLGAAALAYKKKLNWNSPFLGHDIKGDYPVDDLINELLSRKIVGVAAGPAEFGPRALGNRSLLADPRGSEIKATVNSIKRRQQFRPFAPVILEEHAADYFDMPVNCSPYMQFVATCKDSKSFPAICHVDGTSRVQTVPRDCRSGIRQLLEEWYKVTGCPMLLNTSLNIRGKPMVNTIADAAEWERTYDIKVCTPKGNR